MYCEQCRVKFSIIDEIAVAGGDRPKYFHTGCAKFSEVDRILTPKMKQGLQHHRREGDNHVSIPQGSDHTLR